MILKPKNYKEYLSILSSEELSSAPKNIYYEGDFNLIYQGVRVSVVGSRKLSKEGEKRTEIITKELVNNNITVVSGLAEGVDTIAHNTTINNNGKTIAVLGTPLNKCFPAKNKELLKSIKQNHLAISQFNEGSNVFPSNFPKRNKTMALISDATIIIEASEKSGTRHQAWEAVRLGRMVFILDNIAKDPNIKWAQKILEYGARILRRDNYSSIISELSESTFVSA